MDTPARGSCGGASRCCRKIDSIVVIDGLFVSEEVRPVRLSSQGEGEGYTLAAFTQGGS